MKVVEAGEAYLCVCFAFNMHIQFLTLSDELGNDIMLLPHRAGSFIVVDESGKEKAIKDGSKVACIVTQVLFYEQVRALRKSTEWCVLFTSLIKLMIK